MYDKQSQQILLLIITSVSLSISLKWENQKVKLKKFCFPRHPQRETIILKKRSIPGAIWKQFDNIMVKKKTSIFQFYRIPNLVENRMPVHYFQVYPFTEKLMLYKLDTHIQWLRAKYCILRITDILPSPPPPKKKLRITWCSVVVAMGQPKRYLFSDSFYWQMPICISLKDRKLLADLTAVLAMVTANIAKVNKY